MDSHNPFGNSEVEESILMEHLVGTARGYAEMMAYEFSREREQHVETSEKIERAISNSGDLLLSITNWPHKVGSEFRDDSAQQSRTALEDGLRSLAAALEATLDSRLQAHALYWFISGIMNYVEA
jgi:hypothetical protein